MAAKPWKWRLRKNLSFKPRRCRTVGGGGSPPPQPSIFPIILFGVHHLVTGDDRHLLAHEMTSDFSVAWHCLSKRTIVFCYGSNSTPRNCWCACIRKTKSPKNVLSSWVLFKKKTCTNADMHTYKLIIIIPIKLQVGGTESYGFQAQK
jgi:hypothetical protein